MRKLLLILFLIPIHLNSQLDEKSQRQVDSLKQIVNNSNDDSLIVSALKYWDNIIYLFDQDLDRRLNVQIDSICSIMLEKDDLSEESNLFFLKSKSFSVKNLGTLFAYEGDYNKAIEYYTRGLKTDESLNDSAGIAAARNNIGNLYHELGEFDKCLENYFISLELKKEPLDTLGSASTLNNIGNTYVALHDFDEALVYYAKSMDLYRACTDIYGLATGYNNIGRIYYMRGEYTAADSLLRESVRLYEKIADKKGMSIAMNNLGKVYLETGNYELSYFFNNKSLEYAQSINNIVEIRNAAETLWKLNKKTGNYKQAMEMLELFIELKDSLDSELNQKAILRKEFEYNYEKQVTADSIKAVEEKKVAEARLNVEKAENAKQKQLSYFLYGIIALIALFGGFIFNRFRITRKQRDIIESQKAQVESQKAAIESQKAIVDEAYDQLELKNKEVLDSIQYAKRIQSAILPSKQLLDSYLPDMFVLYKPKDIVAGDFYWLEPYLSEDSDQSTVLFAVCDCTGHGVPGAMISVVCNNGLNRAVREYKYSDPGRILDKTQELVVGELSKSDETMRDGMDIALCSLTFEQSEKRRESGSSNATDLEATDRTDSSHSALLRYAGAHNPLWIIRKGSSEIEEYKADKQPIGQFEDLKPFTSHSITVNKGDVIYLFSDGYSDQFGGEKGKKLKASNFKKLLLGISGKPMNEQLRQLDIIFKQWKGDFEQLDDVCVIGVRV